MWKAEYQKEFSVDARAIWDAWVDVNNWPKWDNEIESTNLRDPFIVGTKFQLKPKGGSNVTIEITEVNPLKTFTDVTKFPLAKMHDYHELKETSDGVIMRSCIWVTG